MGGRTMDRRRRALLADVLGLLAVLLVLLDYFRPALLLLPTIAAGGDTQCHYPTAVYFHEHLLPRLRLHGWYPGAYLGHPLLLYYFPLPFLLMSALAPLLGMPVAFKLGTALGVFLLPPLAYAALRLMGFRFPSPLLGAAAAVVFLFLEENPIWGGTIASTLTGEFSYTYGIGLGVLFLGVVYRSYARGGRPWLPAAVLAVTALAHGYAVLWAGLSASYFLYAARRPRRTLAWLLAVAALAAALCAFWLLPLLAGWGWTTPYDDPWITVSPRNLVAAVPGASVRGRARRPRGHRPARAAAPADPTTASSSSRTRRSWPRPWPPRDRPSGSSTCASCPSRSSRSAWRAASPWDGRCGSWPRRSRPRWAWCWRRSSTPTTDPAWIATGSSGTTRASRPRSCGPPSATSPGGCEGPWPTRGWRWSTRPSTRRPARSGCTRRCRSSPAAPRWRACTTRRASRPTPSTTWRRSWTRSRPTPSRAASTRPSTPTTPCATCACSTSATSWR